jgi:hypothetical protein
MAQPGPSITPPVDLNKAFGAAGATGLGGAVTKITMRIINTKWPGLLEGLDDPVDLVITTGLAFLGAWLTPHSH